jgi:Cysteine-rich secretory protein family
MSRLRAPRPARYTVVASAFVLLFTILIPLQSASATDNSSADYVARINSLRASVGVQPLIVDAELTNLAQGWANHMAAVQVLSHSSLTAGITEPWAKLGENVGMGPDNATVWNAFLHSAEHYANLVDPAYNRVGVGVAFGGNSEWTCHKFMELTGAAPPPPPPPPARRASPPATSGSGSGSGSGGSGSGSGSGSTGTLPAAPTTTAAPAPQPGPPPPASSQRVAAVLAALRRLST